MPIDFVEYSEICSFYGAQILAHSQDVAKYVSRKYGRFFKLN